MENSNTESLKSLVEDPSQLTDIINDPAGQGLSFFKRLQVKEQQYLIIAAGAVLIGYGIYLGRKNS
ncbi:hypothetical protein [Pontibacter rugosus]|uniref:Uncharacterized protein n=1 Tax=Pontibacter rugosus TaxID=1745966 RepID=A0ABW3SPL2_9BACT